MWAARCVHEAQLHAENCFITLTYDEEHLPRRPTSLNPDHLRNFFKKLRHTTGPGLRYYACGEYGDQTFRPHYHALLFGYDFRDKQLFKVRDQVRCYISEKLQKIWGKGFCTIGDLTPESAAYCARYTMKKVGGEHAPYYYSELDPYTGDLIPIEPEFSRMSLKPGIGAEWYKKYKDDVFPDDFIVLKGKRMRVPDYYDTLFEREFVGPVTPEHRGSKIIKNRRKDRAQAVGDNEPERLRVKEKVLKAKLKKLKREV